MEQREEAIEIVQARNNNSLKQKEAWGMMGIDMHANKKVELAELGSWWDRKHERGVRDDFLRCDFREIY